MREELTFLGVGWSLNISKFFSCYLLCNDAIYIWNDCCGRLQNQDLGTPGLQAEGEGSSGSWQESENLQRIIPWDIMSERFSPEVIFRKDSYLMEYFRPVPDQCISHVTIVCCLWENIMRHEELIRKRKSEGQDKIHTWEEFHVHWGHGVRP